MSIYSSFQSSEKDLLEYIISWIILLLYQEIYDFILSENYGFQKICRIHCIKHKKGHATKINVLYFVLRFISVLDLVSTYSDGLKMYFQVLKITKPSHFSKNGHVIRLISGSSDLRYLSESEKSVRYVKWLVLMWSFWAAKKNRAIRPRLTTLGHLTGH